MTGNYDVEHLIALVHKRPVLWNKTLDTYKDKLLTKQAWHEICCELDAVFDLKTEEERHDYARDVMKKWWNVRDNYVKICKKMAISPTPVKKYVYHNLLQFLPINDKKFKKEFSATVIESNNIPVESIKTDVVEACHSDHSCDESLRRPQSAAKKRKVATPMTLKKYELVVQPEDRHISFFRGIMPSLEAFDDDDVIQFQMGVLQLVADIKSHRRMQQISEPNHQASSSTIINDADDDSPTVKVEYLGFN